MTRVTLVTNGHTAVGDADYNADTGDLEFRGELTCGPHDDQGNHVDSEGNPR